MRRRFPVALLALALAAAARAEEPDRRRAFRAEATVGAGWADRRIVAGGGRLVLRFAPLVFSLAGQGTSAGRGDGVTDAPDLAAVWTVGAGATWDAGPWEADASALLGWHGYRWPDVLGLGEAETWSPLLGVRLGAGRHLPLRVLGWTTYLGASATVTISGPERSRIRELDARGLAAVLSLHVGLGRPLR